MKPPIQYFGAKISTADRIVALMPAHEGYVEPFAGSLAVLLAKGPEQIEVVNDLDGRLMAFWRTLRDRPEALDRACAMTPHSRAELELAMGDSPAFDDVEAARRVWVLLTQGRSRTMHRTGWRFFANPTRTSFRTYMDAYRARLLPAAERLAGVTLESRPALDVIDQYGQAEENLLYVDPPYLDSVRSGAHGSRYVVDMRDERSHRELADHLHACAGIVMLSGYASSLYDHDLFADWDRVEISAFSGNATDNRRTEVLWANRALGSYLFSLDTDEQMREVSGA